MNGHCECINQRSFAGFLRSCILQKIGDPVLVHMYLSKTRNVSLKYAMFWLLHGATRQNSTILAQIQVSGKALWSQAR